MLMSVLKSIRNFLFPGSRIIEWAPVRNVYTLKDASSKTVKCELFRGGTQNLAIGSLNDA
jgi:hypothetical protein